MRGRRKLALLRKPRKQNFWEDGFGLPGYSQNSDYRIKIKSFFSVETPWDLANKLGCADLPSNTVLL